MQEHCRLTFTKITHTLRWKTIKNTLPSARRRTTLPPCYTNTWQRSSPDFLVLAEFFSNFAPFRKTLNAYWLTVARTYVVDVLFGGIFFKELYFNHDWTNWPYASLRSFPFTKKKKKHYANRPCWLVYREKKYNLKNIMEDAVYSTNTSGFLAEVYFQIVWLFVLPLRVPIHFWNLKHNQ